MKFSTYLFDLDGTLYSRDDLVKKLVEQQYDNFIAELSHIERSRYVERVIELDGHGYHPKEQLYLQIGKEWNLTAGLQAKLLDHFWDSYDAHCHLPEDTLVTLSALRDSGAQMGIVTNGQSDRQNRKIDVLGIREFFDVIVISEAEGLKKPHPEIFRRAVKRCKTSSHESVFVGDHPVADIEGAIGAGLAATWKKVPYWNMDRDDVPVIERLAEILE